MKYTEIQTAIGEIVLLGDERGISNLWIDNGTKAIVRDSAWTFSKDYFTNETEQLLAYLSGDNMMFDFKLAPQGTEFQKEVWKALQIIPYGQTRSYGEVANLQGNPKAARAIGLANNRNPIPILIPCHRVIGANGDLTGYAYGIKLKQYLLDLEKKRAG